MRTLFFVGVASWCVIADRRGDFVECSVSEVVRDRVSGSGESTTGELFRTIISVIVYQLS